MKISNNIRKTGILLTLLSNVGCPAMLDTIQSVPETLTPTAEKFQVGQLVQVKQDSCFFGCIAKVIQPHVERIEQYKETHQCGHYCNVYSLITLHDQQRFECCECYLVAAQVR